MSKRKNIKGEKFGRLLVIDLDNKKTTKNRSYWLCKCDCGNPELVSVYLYQLISGQTKSCGCLKYESETHIKHGHTINKSKSRLYSTWDSMIQRCYNKNNKRYHDYGGRGITVCKEWLNDFMNFYNWAINNGYKDNLTIERINVNGNYEPDNCTWIPMIEQYKNKRNTLYVTYYNKEYSLLELLETLNKKQHYKIIYRRIYELKWSVEDAINVPIGMSPIEYNFQNTLIKEFHNKNNNYKISKLEFREKYNFTAQQLKFMLSKEGIKNIMNKYKINNEFHYLIKKEE